MKEAELDAFVHAARVTFETMLGIDVAATRREHGVGATGGYDVSGIVGLSHLGGRAGEDRGALVISFPEAVARRTVGRILGAECPVLDQDVADGIGELVNVIAGHAKRGLARAGVESCRTALPSVILGSQHRVFHKRDVVRSAVEFECELGTFLLQLLVVLASEPAPAE